MKRITPTREQAGVADPSEALGGASPLMILAFAAVYFVAAAGAIALSGRAGNISAVWFAGAILLWTLMRTKRKKWRPLLMAAIVADLAAQLLAGSNLTVALVVALAGVLETLLIVWALRRWREEKSWFLSPHNLRLFAAAVIAGCASVSFVGSLALHSLEAARFMETWQTWVVADTLGMLIATPLLLSWTDDNLRRMLTRRKIAECVALAAVVAGVAAVSFVGSFPFLFLVFPFLVLLTLRTGVQGATVGVSVVAAVAIWCTWKGMGPIATLSGLELVQKIQVIQLYFLACVLTTLPLAIILAQRQDLHRELKKQVDISSAALNNMAQGLSMYDDQHRLITYNQQYLDLYGVPETLMAQGAPIADVLRFLTEHGIFKGSLDHFMRETADSNSAAGMTVAELGDGRTIHIQRRPLPQGGWVATHQDVTAEREAEQRISFLATHDALTGLKNRAVFSEQLLRELARAKRGHSLALLTIDLDRFKEVNDTLGHWFGDKILKEVASRLLSVVRGEDLVTRMGGDEFAVIQNDVASAHDASGLASRILDVLGRPYEFDGHSIMIAATVGIALAPRDSLDAEELLKKSDLALYKAKADGRATFSFFEAGMDAALQKRRLLETELRAALKKGEFELHYQPILSLQEGTIEGFEALIRWRHPEKGLLHPGEFIQVAEETGLIIPIGEWVLRQSCRDAAEWSNDSKVCVNVAAAQFKRGDLMRVVKSSLSEAGLPAHRLELEMTESALVNDEEWVRAILHSLRRAGIGLAIDDFGTGYASLAYLRSFPFSRIKIDRGFVADICTNDDAHAIISATLQLAAKLGMSTTAEGVETAEQLEMLWSEGCESIQGYLIGKPTKPAEFALHLPRRKKGLDAAAAEAIRG